MSNRNWHVSYPINVPFKNFCSGFRGQQESLQGNKFMGQQWVFLSRKKLNIHILYSSEKEATGKVGSASYLFFIHILASSWASHQPGR